MPPNLRSVVAQGWRSIGSRRNFSSSPRSKKSKRTVESVFMLLTPRVFASIMGYFAGYYMIGNTSKEYEELLRKFGDKR